MFQKSKPRFSEENQRHDGRAPVEPHPDSERNIELMKQWLSIPSIQRVTLTEEETQKGFKMEDGIMSVVWNGTNRRSHWDHESKLTSYSFEELVYVSFYWNSQGRKMGKAFNFHQPTERFRQELERFFSFAGQKPSSMKEIEKQENDRRWSIFSKKSVPVSVDA